MGLSCLCFSRKFLKVQCLESGQWEEGRCIPVVCEPPPPVFEGMYNCTQGFELDSQCVLNCEPQEQQVSDLGRGQRLAKCCAAEHLKKQGSLCPAVQRNPMVASPSIVPSNSSCPANPKLFLLDTSHSTECTTTWG